MKQAKAGFTLIEVLLVTFLLFLLSYATFSSVRSTMATKEDIDATTEILQSNRALMALLERDIANVFYITADDLGWSPIIKRPTRVDPSAIPEPPPPKPAPTTIFQGRADELLMSTRTHQRMNADMPENEQAYVRYRIEQRKLVREESHRVLNKEDLADPKQYVESPIVDDVERLEFKYWDLARNDWADSWDTNGAETLDVLPAAVQVTLVYKPERSDAGDQENKPVELKSIFVITQKILKEGALKK
jgi:type II secretion system protein J